MPARRPIPPCPSAPSDRSPTSSISFSLRLVTPMYGGGAKAGRPDPTYPIRGSSIRGCLRHWWRLTAGYGLSPADLRATEFALWGSPSFPSPVQVRVLTGGKVPPLRTDIQSRFGPFSPEMYALFPAKSKAGDPNPPAIFDPPFSFRLILDCPSPERWRELVTRANAQRERDTPELRLPGDPHGQIRRAVQTWVALGGLGARTRRGLGALAQSNDAPNAIPLPPAVTLIVSAKGGTDPLMAWHHALDVYQWFRQKAFRNDGRRGSNRGRSRWPEPDSLRRITGHSTPGHATPVVAAAHLPCFPKAALGLPIVFKFADGPDSPTGRPGADPGKATLSAHSGTDPETGRPTGDRMASPVIVRPIWQPDRKQWSAGFVFLDPTAALRVRAYFSAGPQQQNGRPVEVPNEQIVGPRAAAHEPMRNLPNAIESLKVFVRSAFDQSGGYQELSG